MKLLIGNILTLLLLTQVAAAQALSDDYVRLLNETANVVCSSLEKSGSNSFLSIDAAAEAEIRTIFRVFGGAEGNLDIDGIISQYQNVPRDELVVLLRSAQSCRLEVFRTTFSSISNSQGLAQNSEQGQSSDIESLANDDTPSGSKIIQIEGLSTSILEVLNSGEIEPPVYVAYPDAGKVDRINNGQRSVSEQIDLLEDCVEHSRCAVMIAETWQSALDSARAR